MTNIKTDSLKNIGIIAGDLTFHLVADPNGKLKKGDIVGVSRTSGPKDVYLDKKELAKFGINLNSFIGTPILYLKTDIPRTYAEGLAKRGDVNGVDLVINNIGKKVLLPPTFKPVYYSDFSDLWRAEVTLKVHKKAFAKYEAFIKNIGEVPPKTLYEAEAVTRGKLDTDQYRLLLRRYRDFVAEIIIHNPQRESSIRQAAESLGIDVDHGNPWPPRGKRSYKEYKEVSEKYKTLIKNIGEVPPKVSGESIIFNGEKYLSEYQFKYGLPQYIDFVAKIILYHPSRGPKIRQAAESLGIPWTDISNRVHYLTNAL